MFKTVLQINLPLATFIDEFELNMPPNVSTNRIPYHINDPEFADKALEVFDAWRANGTIKTI